MKQSQSQTIVFKNDGKSGMVPNKNYEIQRSEHTRLATHAHEICKHIKNQEDYQVACDLLLKVKSRLNQWEKMVDPVVSSAKRAHSEACELRRQVGEPLRRAELEIIKPALARWEFEQERIRKAAETQLKEDTGMEVVLPNTGKAPGITYRTVFFAEVSDVKELARAVADGKIPMTAISPNMNVLHSMAKNFKTGLNWPGVIVKSRREVSARKTYQEDF